MNNAPISDRLSLIAAGTPIPCDPLSFIPLLGPSLRRPDYALLDDTTIDRITIGEVSSAGEVPHLRVTSRLDRRVLILDGEELRGGKQNRIINTTMLIPAKSSVKIPVSCVEAGRWGFNDDRARGPRKSPNTMRTARRTAPRDIRARQASAVHDSLLRHRSFQGNQGEVWDAVHELGSVLEAHSRSSAMADFVESAEKDLATKRRAVTLPENIVGLCVTRGERIVGLDLFDRSTTLHHYRDALIDSYLLDVQVWEGRGRPEEGLACPVADLVKRIGSIDRWNQHRSPGDGTELRSAEQDLVCAALVCEGAPVHLRVFPRSERRRPGYRPTIRGRRR